MEKNFIKVRSSKDCIISFGIIIGGTVLATIPVGSTINNLGLFAVLVGIVLLAALKSGYKDVESGQKYTKTERFFPMNVRQELCAQAASSPNSIDLSSEGRGNTLRLDIYSGNGSDKAYLQVFEYVPHSYKPCTAQYEYSVAEVSKIR